MRGRESPVDRTAFEIEAGHQLGRSSRDDRLLDFWPVLSFTFAKRIEPDGHTSRTSTACGRLALDGLDVRAFKRSALHSQRATGVRYTLAGHAEREPSEARDTAHSARPSDRLCCANRDDTEDRRNDDEHCAGAHSHRPAVLRGCTVLGLLTPAHDLQPMTPSLICTPLPTILGPPAITSWAVGLAGQRATTQDAGPRIAWEVSSPTRSLQSSDHAGAGNARRDAKTSAWSTESRSRPDLYRDRREQGRQVVPLGPWEELEFEETDFAPLGMKHVVKLARRAFNDVKLRSPRCPFSHAPLKRFLAFGGQR